ncbi:MAG: thioredoxin family protein [Ignavibacteria bacterium]|nr:thioredoxin family protein [Ignavibacteria bacterium]
MTLSTIAGKQFEQSFTYESFRNKIEEKIVSNSSIQLDEEAKKLFEYTKLNLQRMKRVEKTFTSSKELSQILSLIKTPQHWVVITEGWCGDSAQNLPAIAKIAKVNPLIELQIIERDDNLDIMDLFLTNGTRSIPILISFDENGNEIFRWGPRPKEAQQLVTRLKSEGMEHDAFVEQLHLWYARNKGVALVSELKTLLTV